MLNWLFSSWTGKEPFAKVLENFLSSITTPVIETIKSQLNKFPMLYAWGAGLTVFLGWLINRKYRNKEEANNLRDINDSLRSQRDRLGRIEINHGTKLREVYERLGEVTSNLNAVNGTALNLNTFVQNLQQGAQNHHGTMQDQFRTIKETLSSISPIVMGTQGAVGRVERIVGEIAASPGQRPK